MSMYELMLYIGIAVAGISVAAGITAFVVLLVSKRRLNAKLDEEYGTR